MRAAKIVLALLLSAIFMPTALAEALLKLPWLALHAFNRFGMAIMNDLRDSLE